MPTGKPTKRMQRDQLYSLISQKRLQQLGLGPHPQQQPQKKVAVYRLYQLSWDSPCLLGSPCPTCAKHKLCHAGEPCSRCLRGRFDDCERATPAKPAFWATVRTAMCLLNWRLATFIHQNTALRLTDDATAHLRDLSSVIDEEVLLLYLAEELRARIAVDKGWGQRRKGKEVESEALRSRFHYR